MRTLLAALLVFWTTGVAAAVAKDTGAQVWQNRCIRCHLEKKAGPDAASHFAKVQWTRFIEQARHKDKVLETFDADARQAVLEFLKQHAADSDSPEVAGLR